ncbi:bifunctional glutamate N-acetyltransferase/amino-acid acetyltransferase ArgJ [Maridesulfovibrio hydrothermalis]|uniref:Arginine biosynthesis bifunctional protein ArgJ n=1 Tax=Maridesulfovibrio hydrothermalis AM13 = DSM 14728 TaxID=1121451 RepID=L0R7X5_9BACT|nr:bifunctional glutamate N-acetyltransferase/amino-acid acetyltransferase ArgJ [Maridesulfovibrio hydrothermalis]CCO22839.1 Arginine biosynthesis bifunctional protein ArgJ [Includes: Glutamate N-acetyltransferase; Amino-acid acetyltransferase] [Maridesulfovibrio hydrothermalis AM13 = DSM 14728]
MLPVPKGYKFASFAAGFKYSGRDDLALILSDTPAAAASVFTKNKFQAAPVTVGKEILAESRIVRGAIINSGMANACTGAEGIADCRESLELAAKALGINARDLLPSSTGVIGPRFNMDKWRAVASRLADGLNAVDPVKAAKAIMTTDKFPKLAWGEIKCAGKTVRILGMCKGAGMISPDMATMLGFITCDAGVEPAWWQEALRRCVDKSFNAITVDGDTSTNDTVIAFANGASEVTVDNDEHRTALEALLLDVCQQLSYMIVQDAEGGTKVMTIDVCGAASDADAELIVRAVGNSPLVKTALFGEDPNWGRIVAAAGRSGAEFDPEKLTLSFGKIIVFEKGKPVQGDLDALLEPVMRKQDIDIFITLGDGEGHSVLKASDLTREYISINADYRS